MDKITRYWISDPSFQKDMKQQVHEKPEEPAAPQTMTLAQAMDLEYELAVCASALFIMIVHNQADLGGGYIVQIIALGALGNKHLWKLSEVESFLAEHTPYVADSKVWVPIPAFSTKVNESDLLLKIQQKIGIDPFCF